MLHLTRLSEHTLFQLKSLSEIRGKPHFLPKHSLVHHSWSKFQVSKSVYPGAPLISEKIFLSGNQCFIELWKISVKILRNKNILGMLLNTTTCTKVLIAMCLKRKSEAVAVSILSYSSEMLQIIKFCGQVLVGSDGLSNSNNNNKACLINVQLIFSVGWKSLSYSKQRM